jgi:hypothetical protein
MPRAVRRAAPTIPIPARAVQPKAARANPAALLQMANRVARAKRRGRRGRRKTR